MTTKTTTTTKTIRKPAKAQATPAEKRRAHIRAKSEKVITQAKAQAKPPVKIPASLGDIRLTKNGKRSVADEIQAQMLKLSKGVETTLHAYCAIGDALVIAKAAVETAKGSWKSFMDDKPLGLAYSTAQRYIQASEFGADKAIASFKAKGGDTLNFKALLSDMKTEDNKAKGKADHGNKGKAIAPQAKAPNPTVIGVADMPLVVSDEFVDQLVSRDIGAMSDDQLARLALAVNAELAQRGEADSVIEGEAA